jgi:hypothetical protein
MSGKSVVDMSRALPKTKICFPENLRSRTPERSECVESGGKINTGSIGWWSGGWKGVVSSLRGRPPIKLRACQAGYVVRSRVVFQTMVRKIGVGSFLR